MVCGINRDVFRKSENKNFLVVDRHLTITTMARGARNLSFSLIPLELRSKQRNDKGTRTSLTCLAPMIENKRDYVPQRDVAFVNCYLTSEPQEIIEQEKERNVSLVSRFLEK